MILNLYKPENPCLRIIQTFHKLKNFPKRFPSTHEDTRLSAPSVFFLETNALLMAEPLDGAPRLGAKWSPRR